MDIYNQKLKKNNFSRSLYLIKVVAFLIKFDVSSNCVCLDLLSIKCDQYGCILLLSVLYPELVSVDIILILQLPKYCFPCLALRFRSRPIFV